MREAAPIPSHVTLQSLVERIEGRHAQEIGLPDSQDVLALCAYIAREALRLSKRTSTGTRRRSDVHDDIHDALLLTRFARQQLDRHELALLHAGKEVDMTARQLGAPLGLTSRAAAGDRIEALQKRTQAARHHTTKEALRSAERASAASTDALAAAAALLEHYDALATNQDADEWAEGIELVMRSPAVPGTAGSVRGQLRALVEEVDRAATDQGRTAAETREAAAALARARDVVRSWSRVRAGEDP